MYSLRDAWMLAIGKEPVKDWDGKMVCLEEDANWAYALNVTKGFVAVYSFTIVTKGWLTLVYNGQQITLRTNDCYIYSPGIPITTIDVSEDFRAYCLMSDEEETLRIPSVRDLVRLAFAPIVQLHEPKMTLTEDVANRLNRKLQEIIVTMQTEHIYKAEILELLYSAFLLDLQGAQEQTIRENNVPKRMEEIFIELMRILPRHFAEHHDIQFYASQLNITADYLSRIVKSVSGRTVKDYIDQLLAMEGAYLLTSSSLTISQIADRLHFADTPSFSKFFSRMKGRSPREYREQR